MIMLCELACGISYGLKGIRFISCYAAEFLSNQEGLKRCFKVLYEMKTLGDTGSAEHPQEILL